MSIHVSEPGRPIGTRLPEVFRGRRVGDVSELTESKAIDVSHSTATDAEFQQAAQDLPHRAIQEYGTAASGQRKDQRAYLPVAEITTTSLKTITANGTVDEALAVMDENDVHHLIVIADNNVAGLVDSHWLLGWMREQRPVDGSVSLKHIELPAFLTASPETDAHHLARLMLAHQLSAALIIDAGGQPTGIVTSTDFLRLYASAGKQEGSV